MDHLEILFKSIGLSDEKAKETAANKKLAPVLESVITAANATSGVDKQIGVLLYQLASTGTSNPHLTYIAERIASKALSTQDQVTAAIKYTAKLGEIDEAAFNQECGVGVVITNEEIKNEVSKLLEAHKLDLQTKRYQMLGQLLGSLRKSLRWANAGAVKAELDDQILAALGPKDERDDLKLLKKNEKKSAPSKPLTIEEMAKSDKFIFEGELAKLHKPGENPQLAEEIRLAHLKRTGGKVVTRFPPEPNGYLHIGHAKAININFGYAAAHNGITYLRYDDTNPEAEEGDYFTGVLDTVKWLGYEPYKITYSSDHFQRLYDIAVELIKKDRAYVCACTPEEMNAMRGGESRGPRAECAHRNRQTAESVSLFERMKNGEFEEGSLTLRMKMDMNNPNPQMWDLVAYRILYTPHHRTGRDWCIYPTYDYTHCLCDSFEDITHSLCTTEFTLSRESYYWLIDQVGDIYKPVQWEYGRLRITNTVLSKRKLNKLVTEKYVAGWDDPRLLTIPGIMRRGFTPQAVNAFVRELGVTTSNTTINVDRLENYVRDHLNQVAPRLFLLQEPILVVLENVPDDFSVECDIVDKVGQTSRKLTLKKEFYIDSVDFKEQSDPNFFRLSPGQSVGLLNVPYPVTCTGFKKDGTGKFQSIRCKYDTEFSGKPKTFIQWLGKDALPVELRLYDKLFVHENPENKTDCPNGWLSDLNPDSLKVLNTGLVESCLTTSTGFTFQAVRVGYFCVDKDSASGALVLNRTVTLKEDSKKAE